MFERTQRDTRGRPFPLSSAPAGWPSQVPPPGAPDWQIDAVAFLFDRCPPDVQRHPVLRRHPVVLAHFARRFVAAEVEAVDAGIAEVRTHLAGVVSEPAIAASIEAWQTEAARLARARRAVGLIEDAVRDSCGHFR